MVREIDETKGKKKHTGGLIENKDYLTEAYLQAGKVIGEMVKPKKGKKR